MSHVDVDLLIELVQKRPQLWDRNNRYHGNRHVIDKCWREITDQMKEDENKLRKKWKYLRDQFSVEYGKIPPGSEDEVRGYEPKWRFYRQLQFLEEVVTPRFISKQLKRDEGSSEQSLSAPDSPLSEVMYKKRPRASEVSAKKPRKHRDTKERERKRARTREREREERSSDGEEHMFFFRSLLPHVRCIPAPLQLPFRSKVQQLVEQFAYGERAACYVAGEPGAAAPGSRAVSDCDPDEEH